jgi:hypothetical protein
MRRTIGIISTATVAAVLNLALSNYFTYAQWAKLSPEGRAAYIAGTFDALINRYDDEAGRAVASHYLDCVARAKMGSTQLGDNLQTYVSARPELQAGTVYTALVKYLGDLCSSHP